MKNIRISLVSQIILTLLGFVSRKVFLDSLGTEYLGVNGLMTNVLSILGLVESGIGTSIVFSLYKPLAEKDEDKIIALIQLYKKIYKALALIIFILSLTLYPFLGYFMTTKQMNYSTTTVIFFIFVAQNMISYLYAHKWSLINADQKGYVRIRISLIFQVLLTICKILVLRIFNNYILFLIIGLLFLIIQNVINGRIVDKHYPYIKTNQKYEIEQVTKGTIISNVKAMFLHNIGGKIIFGTDNILISSFVSISAVGLYSNYTLIIDQLSSLVAPFISGIGASVGNLIATESKDKTYSIFKVTYLLNFWIYSLSTIILYNLLEPFINWWLGRGYLLDRFTLLIVLTNFYLTGMRASVLLFKIKAGIFKQDKYCPIIEALINLVTSIILIRQLGLVGTFIGTMISTLAVPFWNQPRMIYKHIFKLPVKLYFTRYIFYILISLVTGSATTSICNIITDSYGLLSLVLKGFISLVVINTFYVIVFYKSEEFKYLLNIFKSTISRINGNPLKRKRTAVQ
jgi:O-antigen/teichoic acid export membrane protein